MMILNDKMHSYHNTYDRAFASSNMLDVATVPNRGKNTKTDRGNNLYLVWRYTQDS